MSFCIPNYDIYRTDREDGLKGDTAVEVKKPSLSHPPLLSGEAEGIA
jgi:hypothetical protein